MTPSLRPKFFATPDEFGRWLKGNHDKEKELVVGFYKVDSGKPSMTWPEAVDEALCYGWIDGVRNRIDETSYQNRFTPRRAGSNWSLVNRRRFVELRRLGRVAPAGLKAFAARSPARTGVYSYENRKKAKFSKAEERLFRADAAAWRYFRGRPPGYRALVTWFVVSAKREETRARRLAKLIAEAAAAARRSKLGVSS